MKRIIKSRLINIIAPLFMIAANAQAEDKWLSYPGANGPGKGKHIVLIAADQEYRSEQAIPMLAKILATHHGFDTTVLFAVNKDGLVDPTMPSHPEKGKEDQFQKHSIPGIEKMAQADLVIFFHRLLTLPDDQMKAFVDYFDSGKPSIYLRTANHGFLGPIPYTVNGKKVSLSDMIGGTFLNHHGIWSQDSTRGDIVPEQKNHPILTGVKNIWGLTDVYRTYKEGDALPADCTALVWGQPLLGREPNSPDNKELVPLPVVWFKNWITSQGKQARILHSTMGGGKDFQNEGLRRLVVNGAYWGLKMEDKIKADSSVEYVGEYKPFSSGFHYEELGVKAHPISYYK